MLRQLKGVFKSFENHKVKYVVIGGLAVIVHGVPRSTLDLDILIEATRENAENLLKALFAAGLGTATLLTADELLKNEITSFKDFVSIDVRRALRA